MPTDPHRRKRTVVHVIDGLGRGGAEHLLTSMAPELQRQGFDVRVVVLQDREGNPAAEKLRDRGISVELLALDKLRRIGQFSRAIRRLRDMKPDVIHAHLEAATILTGVARVVLGVPVVATLHTLEHPERFSRASARLWVRDRFLINVFDRVICLSSALEAEARQHGLANARVTSISNGIDVQQFERMPVEAARAMRTEFGIPETAALVITVAVLRQQKGIDRLIRAMQRVRASITDVHLLVIGDGEDRQRLENLSEELGLCDAVTFAGFREDVAGLLGGADLFVLPTLWDALPTVLIEAMAAHLPIVASNVGGIPDMVRDGVEGLLVPTDDDEALATAISQIMSDAALREDMALAARLRAETAFSLPNQVGKVAALYREVIGAHG